MSCTQGGKKNKNHLFHLIRKFQTFFIVGSVTYQYHVRAYLLSELLHIKLSIKHSDEHLCLQFPTISKQNTYSREE